MSADRLAELAAEYAVLDAFDLLRRHAGHDYGAGQRGAELNRRRWTLEARGIDVAPAALDYALDRAAFERVARPRIRRIEAESYRRETPATKRTLQTWRRVERMVSER
jgi:hypothetical protein